MKIYNEILLKWNDESNQLETLSEDSYEYFGEVYQLQSRDDHDNPQPPTILCDSDNDCTDYADLDTTISADNAVSSYCNTEDTNYIFTGQESYMGICQYCVGNPTAGDIGYCQCGDSVPDLISANQWNNDSEWDADVYEWLNTPQQINVGDPYIINRMFPGTLCVTEGFGDNVDDWLDLADRCDTFKYADIIGNSNKYVIIYNDETW